MYTHKLELKVDGIDIEALLEFGKRMNVKVVSGLTEQSVGQRLSLVAFYEALERIGRDNYIEKIEIAPL